MTEQTSQVQTFHVLGDIRIEQPPERVFDCVTDLAASGQWSPECGGGTWIVGAAGQVGSVFRGNNHREPTVVQWAPVVRGDWSTESEVVEAVRPEVFRWAMRDSAGNTQESVWSYEISADGTGSILTHRFWMGRLTEGMRGIMAEMDPDSEQRFIADWGAKIADDIGETLRRIKTQLESGSPR